MPGKPTPHANDLRSWNPRWIEKRRARFREWRRIRHVQQMETFRLKKAQAQERHELHMRQMGYRARMMGRPLSSYHQSPRSVEPEIYAEQTARHQLWIDGWEMANRQREEEATRRREYVAQGLPSTPSADDLLNAGRLFDGI